MTSDLEWKVEPEVVEGIKKDTVHGEPEVLIKWKGLPSFESSWEPMKHIADQYPDFHLEDKVSSLRGEGVLISSWCLWRLSSEDHTREGSARSGRRKD